MNLREVGKRKTGIYVVYRIVKFTSRMVNISLFVSYFVLFMDIPFTE